MTNRFFGALIAAGATFAATAALAQGYYDNDYPYDPGYRSGPPEQVIVLAPDYYAHHAYPSNQLGRPPEQTTLSLPVSFSDLDLTTYDGAHALRERVRDAAHDICGELSSRYPIRMAVSEPCYKKAVESGLNRANSAIREARYEARDGYEGDGY